MRIVFDAATEYEWTSPNKNMLSGPDMTSRLVGVHLRFRQGTIGIVADIEGMFHQICVREEDIIHRSSYGAQIQMKTRLMFMLGKYIYSKQHLLLVLQTVPCGKLPITMPSTLAPMSLQI